MSPFTTDTFATAFTPAQHQYRTVYFLNICYNTIHSTLLRGITKIPLQKHNLTATEQYYYKNKNKTRSRRRSQRPLHVASGRPSSPQLEQPHIWACAINYALDYCWCGAFYVTDVASTLGCFSCTALEIEKMEFLAMPSKRCLFLLFPVPVTNDLIWHDTLHRFFFLTVQHVL